MTAGIWCCLKCGCEKRVHVSDEISECPECGAGYELVKRIKPHLFHEVSVMKEKESGRLVVPLPIAFLFNPDKPEDVAEYKQIVKELFHVEL